MHVRMLILAHIVVLCSLHWHPTAHATTPFFMGLGDLPGGAFDSSATGVSADGSVVVGSSAVATAGNPHHPQALSQAFRWTLESGMVGLGDLPGGPIDSSASGVSADGSVIVGSSAVDTISSHGEPPFRTLYRAFRWTQGQGMSNLGRLRNWNTTSFAYDVSADGTVVVGMSGVHPLRQAAHGEAFRWRQGPGMVGLGELPGYEYSHASGVSADGSVVVGRSWSGAHQFIGGEAFRWTQGSGMIGLGDLPGGAINSHAHGVSSDGSVVVGQGTSDAGKEAFRWTQGSGITGLGDLPGGLFSSSATDVSADGSVIVGTGNSASGPDAFLWDATHGMRSLRDVLGNDFGLGARLAGWTLTSANDISADGQFVVGSGTNPNGNTEAWIARLAIAPALPGDYNGNGAIDAADYTVWQDSFGQTGAGLAADGSGNGSVDAADYNLWKTNFGAAGAAAVVPSGIDSAVPEPATIVMFAVNMIAACALNGRRMMRSRRWLGMANG